MPTQRSTAANNARTKGIRVDAETARLVKIAAARNNESIAAWVYRACRERLEKEGKSAPGDRTRVASVEFLE